MTTGYTDGTFKPERPLTKAHAVLFLERYYDEVLQANQSEDFTRGEMMVLLRAMNDGDIGIGPTPLSAFSAISAGVSHSCGLRTDGTAQCWGNKDFGRADAPSGVFTAISAGESHSCGLRTDGTAQCWGYNGSGQTDAPLGEC